MKIGLLLSVLVVAGLSAGAYAEVINGDFSSSTTRGDGTLAPTGWSVALTPADVNLAKQDIVGGVLTLRAYNTYAFDPLNGWSVDQGEVSVVDVYQNETYAPAGTTGLQFTGSANFTGSEFYGNAVDGPRALIAVFYNNPQFETQSAIWSIVGDAGTQTIPMPGLDTAQPVMVRIYMTSEVCSSDWPEQAAVRAITATASFDNISFVPEPATMLLLSAGLLGLVRRRKTA